MINGWISSEQCCALIPIPVKCQNFSILKPDKPRSAESWLRPICSFWRSISLLCLRPSRFNLGQRKLSMTQVGALKHCLSHRKVLSSQQQQPDLLSLVFFLKLRTFLPFLICQEIRFGVFIPPAEFFWLHTSTEQKERQEKNQRMSFIKPVKMQCRRCTQNLEWTMTLFATSFFHQVPWWCCKYVWLRISFWDSSFAHVVHQ